MHTVDPAERPELPHMRRFVITFHMPDQTFIDEPYISARTQAEAILLFDAFYLGWPYVDDLEDDLSYQHSEDGESVRPVSGVRQDIADAVAMELFEYDGGDPLARYELEPGSGAAH